MENIEYHFNKENATATITSRGVVLTSPEDALDIIGNLGYNGADNLIVRAENISPDFFELKSGVAGEILQKFTQYGMRLAIIGDFSDTKSKSLRDFIKESNRHGRTMFLANEEEALNAFAGNR